MIKKAIVTTVCTGGPDMILGHTLVSEILKPGGVGLMLTLECRPSVRSVPPIDSGEYPIVVEQEGEEESSVLVRHLHKVLEVIGHGRKYLRKVDCETTTTYEEEV